MVEGGKIDWACPRTPPPIRDTIAFDRAIDKAVAFADNTGETLIIVTGDHENRRHDDRLRGTQYATFFDKADFRK